MFFSIKGTGGSQRLFKGGLEKEEERAKDKFYLFLQPTALGDNPAKKKEIRNKKERWMLLAFVPPFQKTEQKQGLGEAKIIWSHPSFFRFIIQPAPTERFRPSLCFPPPPTALQTDKQCLLTLGIPIYGSGPWKISPTDIGGPSGQLWPTPLRTECLHRF